MRQFSDYNPIAVTVYFICTAGLCMFSMNPVIVLLSLIGSVVLVLIRNGVNDKKSLVYFLVIFVVAAIINPIFSHNGVTVLFVINDIPITLEALIYGIVSSAMIVSELCWFRSFSKIMTSDKLLYLMGKISPKIALIFSTALRYVPLFEKQTIKVKNVQKALGLSDLKAVSGQFRYRAKVISVMTTWALENGIVTSDSMTARGYGTGKRTHFSLFRFRKQDAALVISSLALFSITLIGIAAGDLDFSYYPAITAIISSKLAAASYISYSILAFLPAILKVQEVIKWKYLMSRI